MKKFQLGEDWIPKKLDVAFEVPDFLALEPLQAKGVQPGEVIMDGESSFAEDEEQQNPEQRLYSYSYSSFGATQNIEPDSEAIATLVSMGIDVTQAITALKACNNDAQRAIEYIFDPLQHLASSASDAQPFGPNNDLSDGPTGSNSALTCNRDSSGDDSNPKLYQLKAFISHMGPSTMSGHYVCHIRKDERWYIFNDNKVAISENPPKEFGYLYFYEQMTL